MSEEELTRRRAMRIGGGLVSTGVTFSGIDGLLRVLLDDPPTEVEEPTDESVAGDDTDHSPSTDSTASSDPSRRVNREPGDVVEP